jgi:photosystem II stability/assembly factor-like uncharacterized protein
MKLVIIINFIFLSYNAFAQKGWINQTPNSPIPGLYGVYALDKDNIWVAGEEGTIRHSTDGGVTWDSVASGVPENLYTVEFINSDTGWVAGKNNRSFSTVLRTTDAGLSWKSQALSGGGAIPIYDVDFIKGDPGEKIYGFITGGLGFTWKTEDFGDNWNSVRNKCENTFWSCCFSDNNTGWFVGTPSVAEPYTIMQTADGGDTWQEQTNPTERNLRGVCFASPLKGIAVGLSGAIVFTEDGGKNWQTSSYSNAARWESVYLTKSGKAWAVGSKGRIIYSQDWGQSWVTQESGVNIETELWEVYFINDNEGWIVGGGTGQPGVILHTTNGGVVSDVEAYQNQIADKFSLEQNYPNPFNPATKIRFTIPKAETVKLQVYNTLGQIVGNLVENKLQAGMYEVEFNADNLPSGVHFYRLQAGEYVDVKKMILLK